MLETAHIWDDRCEGRRKTKKFEEKNIHSPLGLKRISLERSHLHTKITFTIVSFCVRFSRGRMTAINGFTESFTLLGKIRVVYKEIVLFQNFFFVFLSKSFSPSSTSLSIVTLWGGLPPASLISIIVSFTSICVGRVVLDVLVLLLAIYMLRFTEYTYVFTKRFSLDTSWFFWCKSSEILNWNSYDPFVKETFQKFSIKSLILQVCVSYQTVLFSPSDKS